MRIWLFSDLHRDVSGSPWTPASIPAADVAVVPGDVGRGLVDSVTWLAQVVRPAMQVVLVPGNHEFYALAVDEELDLARRAAERLDVVLLDDGTAEVAGCAFSGCTLWTDYALHGEAGRQAAMQAARRVMNDHRLIARTRSPAWRAFGPADALAAHETSRRFLERATVELDPPGARTRPHVVVTHHAPSPASVAPAFAGSALNPAFASDLTALIEAGRPDLWLHGHVHARLDHRVGATRVACNPRGYDGERTGFDPALVLEVAA